MSGTILPGDLQHFRNALSSLPSDSHPVIIFDSPGGIVGEGVDIAEIIHGRNLPTFVTNQCMSICFVMFAAGGKLGYEPNAQIGVHSARDRENEQETMSSMAATMVMVRSVQSYRVVPPQVLGKLVGTTPDGITILTSEDLSQLGAEIYSQTPTTAAVQPVQPVIPPLPTALQSVTPQPETSQQGRTTNGLTNNETLISLVIVGGIFWLVYRHKR